MLIVAVAGAIRAVEAREVRAALAATSGDRAQLVVNLPDDASADAIHDATDEVLQGWGAGDGLVITEEDGSLVIAPDLGRITGDQTSALADQLGGLRDAIEEKTDLQVEVSGSLDSTLGGIQDQIEVRRGPTAVAVGLLALLTAVVIGAVAVETVRVRQGELHLLRARGARRRDLVGLGALETFVVAMLGALLGAFAGLLLTDLIGGVSAGAGFALIAAAAIAVVAVAVVVVSTFRGIDRGSTRARATAGVGAVVILAVVTGIALWQFAQAGTPLVLRGDGTLALDPLVALAPALALAFAALLVVAIATPLARGITAVLTPTRAVSPITPMRLALRRPGRHALPITVVAFAVGTVTLAGAYQGSLTALGDAPESLRVGADVRVRSVPEGVNPSEIATLQPSDAAMLVRPLNAKDSEAGLSILAVEAPALGDVMLDAGGTIDPAALGAAISLPAVGVPLAGDTLSVTLLAPEPPPVSVGGEEMSIGAPAADARVTVLSASGAIETFDLGNVEDDPNAGNGFGFVVDDDKSATFDLPAGEDWSLVSIDVAYSPVWFAPDAALEVVDVSSGDEAVDLSGFAPGAGTPGSVEVIDDGLRFTPDLDYSDPPSTRAVAPGVPAVIPAVVTAGIADSMSLSEGEKFSLELASPDYPADFEVAAIVPVLPGTATGEGMLVDLAALSMIAPTEIVPSQVWFSSDDPGALAAEVRAQYDRVVVTVADPRSAENAAGTAVAFLLAAAGAVVLAFVVLILRRTRSRADSRELALLAVMGLGRRRAARVRAGEDVFAIVLGTIGGIVAGVATALLVVPPLVRAAYGSVPDSFPIDLHVQPLLLTLALAVFVGVCCAIVATVRAPAKLAPFVREDE